jgi:hypothetical protein
MERDKFMSAADARAFGLVDAVLVKPPTALAGALTGPPAAPASSAAT